MWCLYYSYATASSHVSSQETTENRVSHQDLHVAKTHELEFVQTEELIEMTGLYVCSTVQDFCTTARKSWVSTKVGLKSGVPTDVNTLSSVCFNTDVCVKPLYPCI